ncbi:MAG: hypothetical protein EA423_04510 [Phycisphaerales bacterium]|nr:MAG: hypothetical protein EA423_04510 [Phycisphaerales bacterium]
MPEDANQPDNDNADTLASPSLLADLLARILADREAELASEQAVRGLDAMDELPLHRVLAEGLGGAGLGVFPEFPYPGRVWDDEGGRRPGRNARDRCDLVLTPSADLPPADPVATLQERDEADRTLFGSHVRDAIEREHTDPGRPWTDPAEAFWLEVKTVGQFAFKAGAPDANRAYASELVAAGEDLGKLGADGVISRGALLLLLFAADEETVRHDGVRFVHACLDRGLPAGSPVIRCVPIVERIGNTCCGVVLAPLRA